MHYSGWVTLPVDAGKLVLSWQMNLIFFHSFKLLCVCVSVCLWIQPVGVKKCKYVCPTFKPDSSFTSDPSNSNTLCQCRATRHFVCVCSVGVWIITCETSFYFKMWNLHICNPLCLPWFLLGIICSGKIMQPPDMCGWPKHFPVILGWLPSTLSPCAYQIYTQLSVHKTCWKSYPEFPPNKHNYYG